MAGASSLALPREEAGAFHNYQTYAVQLDAECNRDQILGALRREGIEAQIGANAIHRETVFRAAKITGNLKHAECLADQLLALPLHHKLEESDQELVANRLMELAR